MSDQVWKKCSTCKKDILMGATYQKCSVSSCRKHAFCSVRCWDVHAPIMNHKSAWAEEERGPKRRIVAGDPKSSQSKNDSLNEILIIASKLKSYVKDKHGYNTSGNVADILSKIVRIHVDEAINNARAEGRKTLMDRDFK